ncbi:hypothetical protein BK659_08580 [Pseudomonas brassicacearum]|uniref:DUF2931 family protein n=1 Tax=Pseudomonas brassicacearum TaxID=930166 RepID=A0A423H9Q3_9PSED|nr:DUF2931 family protein [Pseudomonas brassicacearum]RON09954.1 hypothetical protein BK659_08580 [Pseudomonas brassicacearum]
MKRLTLLLGLLFSLSACASGPQPPVPPKLPYNSWYVGLAAPRHMEVWVETVDVLDQRGLAFFNVHAGVASYTGKVEGWHQGGETMPVTNVDLPERLFLRWQSLVEPQAYKIRIPIPQWVRDEMVRPERVFCEADQKEVTLYRNRVNLGMAPGGIVKVWVGAGCLGYKEVGRFQAEVEPLGPYIGKSNGKYIPIEPENKAYVDQHGIPYGTW